MILYQKEKKACYPYNQPVHQITFFFFEFTKKYIKKITYHYMASRAIAGGAGRLARSFYVVTSSGQIRYLRITRYS